MPGTGFLPGVSLDQRAARLKQASSRLGEESAEGRGPRVRARRLQPHQRFSAGPWLEHSGGLVERPLPGPRQSRAGLLLPSPAAAPRRCRLLPGPPRLPGRRPRGSGRATAPRPWEAGEVPAFNDLFEASFLPHDGSWCLLSDGPGKLPPEPLRVLPAGSTSAAG